MAIVSGKVIHIHLPESLIIPVGKLLTLKGVFEPIRPLDTYTTTKYEETVKNLYILQKEYQVIMQQLRDLQLVGSSPVSGEATQMRSMEHTDAMDDIKQELCTYNELNTEIDQRKIEIEFLSYFKDMDAPLTLSSGLVRIAPFTIARSKYKDIVLTLASSAHAIVVPMFESDDELTAMILYVDTVEDKIMNLLQRSQANIINLVHISDNLPPSKQYKSFKEKIHDLEKEKREVFTRLKALVIENYNRITNIVQYLGFEIQSYDLLEYFTYGDTKNEVIISGWTDSNSVDDIVSSLKDLDKRITVEVEEGLNIEPKVTLSNDVVSKPFEEITKLIGVPSSSELDPTPFLTPFFIIFFGFALGDGGYGLFMLLLSAYVWYSRRLNKVQVNMLLLFAYCGLSTVIFGALTGSWFGVSPENMPPVLSLALQPLQVINVQRSVMLILTITLLAGLSQQILGVFLQALVFHKQKLYADIFWKTGSVLMLMVSLGLMFFGGQIGLSQGLVNMMPNIALLTFFLFLYGHGRSAKNVFMRPVAGLMNVFDLIGYLSNTLSYARILAMGLATGVIAGVINLLAGLFGGDGIVGFVLTVIILIVGHVFNLVLNLLGTFVNVTRLQLVEFFPRFFEAKGEEIVPTQTAMFFSEKEEEKEAISYNLYKKINRRFTI